jgi:hypothetical protein
MEPLFTSEVFDLGIDEVGQDYNGSRWVADQYCKNKEPAKLFAQYVNRLADYTFNKGKIPLVNSTPFVKKHGGGFHNIYKSVALIRKDIIINNWSERAVRKRSNSLVNLISPFKSTDYFAEFGHNRIVHMVGHKRRWKDRPELLETKGHLDCYGAFITHYSYMTGSNSLRSSVFDDMAFSSNHFWTPNHPQMGTEMEEDSISYSKIVMQTILDGKSVASAVLQGQEKVLR